MKNSFFYLVLILFISTSAFCQTKKAFELLQNGIEANDAIAINKALAKGASINDALTIAVEQNKIDYVRDFINLGADPSFGLSAAVLKNNLIITKYLFEKGAKFIDKQGRVIVGEVLLCKADYKIPITFDNQKNCWTKNTEKNKKHESINYELENGYEFSYTTKWVKVGNQSLIYAIANNNLQMVQYLIKQGVGVNKISSVRDFSDFMISFQYGTLDEVTFIKGSGYLIPDLIMRPIEYAIFKNADKSIVDELLKYDSIPNYKYDIKKILCVNENPKVSEMEVFPFGYGFTLKFKLKANNVYAYKLAYSVDNLNYNVSREFLLPIDTIKSIPEYEESITHYYYNDFGDSIHPSELKIKIIPKEYGNYTDPRDGEVYKTVMIDDNIIMADNFRHKMPSDCWTYNDDEKNISKYGYLYGWAIAKIAVPKGWHLPSAEEMSNLFTSLEKDWYNLPRYERYLELAKVLELGGSSGFSMLYGGARQFGVHKEFNWIGRQANFWSSTPSGGKALSASFVNMNNSNIWLSPFWIDLSYMCKFDRGIGCSVRLFKDK